MSAVEPTAYEIQRGIEIAQVEYSLLPRAIAEALAAARQEGDWAGIARGWSEGQHEAYRRGQDDIIGKMNSAVIAINDEKAIEPVPKAMPRWTPPKAEGT